LLSLWFNLLVKKSSQEIT